MKFSWVQNTSRSIPRKYHIIFWGCYFIFNVIRWGSYYEDYWYSLKSNLVTFPMAMLLAYINIYFLIPKFIQYKKFKRYIIYLIGILCVYYVVRTELIYLLINENVWPESDSPQKAYSFNHIVVVFLIGIYEVALVTTIKLSADWIYERNRVANLQEVQVRTELDFLKSQIQPHFFFNTLNNLYALALEKSDIAPSVILKLSDIMQYVLYDVRESKVRLFNEIKYINNYIDLERLRFGDEIDVTIDIVGEIEGVSLPPLLFLPFIENCFKHSDKKNNNVKINIAFKIIDNKFLEFRVMNYILNESIQGARQGIGNKNVRRRLELLYKANFELATEIEENTYNVFLKIPIND